MEAQWCWLGYYYGLGLTSGGTILQMPNFSASGRIFSRYSNGFRANSACVGWYTGHSGGDMNSGSVFEDEDEVLVVLRDLHLG